MTDVRTHSAAVELVEPSPAEVPVGAAFALTVRVTCAEGCDLSGLALHIAAPDGAGETRQTEADGDDVSVRQMSFQAPQRVGDQVWRLSLLPHDAAGVRHEAEALLSIGVTTKPHASSLAVWDIPSPVVIGEAFTIKAGAKSSGDHPLNGQAIEVCDETGAVVAQARLGDMPWPGTCGLHWTQLALRAPDKEGSCSWSVRFAALDIELPHHGASANFSLVVARPAEHRLSVKVREKDAANPIEDAEVRVGVYRARTDGAGMATVEMPKGTYEIVVWKVGYDIPTLSRDVNADSAVEIEAIIVPEEDPDAIWQM